MCLNLEKNTSTARMPGKATHIPWCNMCGSKIIQLVNMLVRRTYEILNIAVLNIIKCFCCSSLVGVGK